MLRRDKYAFCTLQCRLATAESPSLRSSAKLLVELREDVRAVMGNRIMTYRVWILSLSCVLQVRYLVSFSNYSKARPWDMSEIASTAYGVYYDDSILGLSPLIHD